MVTAKVWQLAKQPKNEPAKDDFACVEEKLPPCQEGGVIVEAVCLSVDPYMRFRLRTLSFGSTMMGEQVAKVIESKNPEWPVGSHMLCHAGWRSHTHLSPADLRDAKQDVRHLPDLGTLPKSLALGILGMPGNTAYLSFMEVVRPKAGETVLVNAAAGAVGSIVVQLAKLSGCKVVAFAGTDEKVAWLKKLGADHAFNYKTVKVGDALAQAAPEKINIYYDNVGGKFSSEVIVHMAPYHARVLVCGVISGYHTDDWMTPSLTSPFHPSVILMRELTIQGFVVYSWKHRWDESFRQLKKWVEEGKLQYKETVVQGFNNMPDAFAALFHGTNIGKVIVMP